MLKNKQRIKEIIVKHKIINNIFLFINDIFIYLIKKCLKALYAIRIVLWGAGTRTRPFNDFDISVFYKWGKGDLEWMMLSVLSMLSLMQMDNNKILDIGCGDGWFFKNIFFHKKDIISYKGIDINENAIRLAKKRIRFLKTNIDVCFCLEDIRKYSSEERYSNVFWYGSMCIFSKQERLNILGKISQILQDGILCGTATVANSNENIWELYENPYKSTLELLSDLECFFLKNKLIHLGENSWFFISTNNESIKI